MPQQSTKTISLRLPVTLVRELERRGQAEHCSAGEVARRYVNERLADGNGQDILGTVTSLQQQLNERLDAFEAKFLIAMKTLLVDAGKASVEEADQWADENLR